MVRYTYSVNDRKFVLAGVMRSELSDIAGLEVTMKDVMNCNFSEMCLSKHPDFN